MPDGRDPSGYLEGPNPSSVVKIVGTARNDINGLTGIVMSFNVDRERYLVHMTKSQSTMALKKENLVKASMMESYQAQWQQLQNDPRVREKMSHYMALCEQYVAPFKLVHAIAGVVFVWLTMMYFIGFTKTLMTTSLILLILVMVGPDVLARSSPPRVILARVPDRARLIIEQQLPFLKGKLTNKMAVGIVLLMVVLTIQSLLFGGRSRAAARSSSSAEGASPLGVSNDLSSHHPPHRRELLTPESMEKYYNLGFADATNGAEQGASLSELLATFGDSKDDIPLPPNGEAPPRGTHEDHDYLYDFPPDLSSTKTGINRYIPQFVHDILGKFTNMSNLMSLFYIYRSIMDLGLDQSTRLFSIGQLAANFQHHTEWWRKILLALSVVNVIRVFF